jgi:hypothetical protein
VKYFVTTLAAAQSLAQPLEMATGISAIKAKQEGCEGVTAFWWPLIRHPDGQQVAICIPDDQALPTTIIQDGEPVEVPAEIYQSGAIKIEPEDLIDELPEGWQTAAPPLA